MQALLIFKKLSKAFNFFISLNSNSKIGINERSRSFYRLEEVVQNITGYKLVIPTHQGRGAEQVVFPNIIKHPGDLVISNMHFDTTKARVEISGGRALNCVDIKAFDTEKYDDFKGDFDLVQLEKLIEANGADKISSIVITITCNSAGGQPVSMANIKAVTGRF